MTNTIPGYGVTKTPEAFEAFIAKAKKEQAATLRVVVSHNNDDDGNGEEAQA
jgi:hypothetical protein